MSQTAEWHEREIYQRADGSYIIHMPHPYHVPNEGEFAELWAAVTAYLNETGITPEPEPLPPPPPPPTPDELESQFSALVTARLNAFAAERQYDDITTARLAALSSEYQADGQAAQAAYDATWTAAIALVSQVRSGDLTPEQAVELLPALSWPE